MITNTEFMEKIKKAAELHAKKKAEENKIQKEKLQALIEKMKAKAAKE